MKMFFPSFQIALLFVFSMIFLLNAIPSSSFNDEVLKAEWENYKQIHKKHYDDNNNTMTNNTSEDLIHYENWYHSLEQLLNHNESWQVSLNEFSDISTEEKKSNYLNLKANRTQRLSPPPIRAFIEKFFKKSSNTIFTSPNSRSLASFPSSFDWRMLGKVTPVKNQAKCGSCWAFSTIASLESLNLILNITASNATANFSEEQQVNCDTWNYGCQGGDPATAMDWAYFNGTTVESNYPYTSATGVYTLGASSCKGLTSGFTSYGAQTVQSFNETALIAAVNLQPVVVTVYADYWFSYAGGVFGNCTNVTNGGVGTNDHAVLLVGYTPTTWIIKNSWGTNWGEKGFINLNRTNPLCGAMISQDANYPLSSKRSADLDPYCKYYSASYCANQYYISYMMGKKFEYNLIFMIIFYLFSQLFRQVQVLKENINEIIII